MPGIRHHQTIVVKTAKEREKLVRLFLGKPNHSPDISGKANIDNQAEDKKE